MFTMDEDWGAARTVVAAAGEAGDRIAARLGRLIAGIQCLPDATP